MDQDKVLLSIIMAVVVLGAAYTTHTLTINPDKSPVIVCTAVYNPVCGVNGVTYSNDCYANAAGVEINYVGECIKEPTTFYDQDGLFDFIPYNIAIISILFLISGLYIVRRG